MISEAEWEWTTQTVFSFFPPPPELVNKIEIYTKSGKKLIFNSSGEALTYMAVNYQDSNQLQELLEAEIKYYLANPKKMKSEVNKLIKKFCQSIKRG